MRAVFCRKTAAFDGLRGGATLAAWLFFFSSAAAGGDSWLVGEPLQHALQQRIGISWSNVPIRPALDRLATSQKVAILLDRRVDPGRKVELSFENVSLREALQRIASRTETGVTMLGPAAYFGPPETTRRLRTLAALRIQEANRFPVVVRNRWLHPRSWKWDDLTAPRDLMNSLSQESGARIDGLEQIPADLWSKADLPPMNLPERLTLLLAQYDLTFETASDGSSILLVPMPAKPVLDRAYSVSGSASEAAGRLRGIDMLAAAEIEVSGGRLLVRGTAEVHEMVDELLSGRKARRSTVQEGHKVYTLRVEAQVSKLLDAVGKQLGVEFQVEQEAIAAAGLSLAKVVKLDVKEVGEDELLRAILEPAGLTFQRRDRAIEIIPAPPRIPKK